MIPLVTSTFFRSAVRTKKTRIPPTTHSSSSQRSVSSSSLCNPESGTVAQAHFWVARTIQTAGSAFQTMTDTASPEYYQLVDIHDRQYQHYSVTNSVYLVPVDEVRQVYCAIRCVVSRFLSFVDLGTGGRARMSLSMRLIRFRRRKSDLTFSIGYCTTCLIAECSFRLLSIQCVSSIVGTARGIGLSRWRRHTTRAR